MNGFGQDLKKATQQTILFRKVSGVNFLNFGELCFSTEKSAQLIGAGEFCLVLEKAEYSGVYAEGDADAGKNFGYDEFRVEMTQDELTESITNIVVPNSWYDDIDESLYDSDQDPMVWIDNIETELNLSGICISESDFNSEIKFNF